jgi:putative ABC transport system ATP-binding protein
MPQSNSLVVDAQNVTKDYPLGTHTVQALRGVDLRVSSGEFLCVVGPSGSGKTTLLNLIGCLDVPTSGKVTLFGEFNTAALDDAKATRLRRDRIGFIFQSFNLMPVLDVRENIGLPLELQRVEREEIAKRVERLVLEVGLTEFASHRPEELSGGQRQRVAVARALVTNPDLVLADEPTANLDHDSGMAVLELMRKMNQTHGTTFLFSTHDPKVMQMASRTVTMVDGRIQAAADAVGRSA